MRSFSKYLAVVVSLAFAASLAFAGNQNIIGKILLVKQKPGDTSTRNIKGTAKEKSSSDTLVGDPTTQTSSVDGAILDVFANAGSGGTSSSQSYTLPHGSWSKIDNQGFKYKDPKGTNGPVKSAIIKRTKSGVFLIKVKITAKNGAVAVFPPDPGDSGCVALKLAAGDRYSVEFNNTGNNVTNVDGKLFKVKKPTDDSTACPQVTPTTTTSSTSAAPTTTTSTTTSATGVVITTTTSTTTTTTMYGSPSRAFLAASADLLD